MRSDQAEMPPYGWQVYRCLHSALIDYILGAPRDVAHVITDRALGGQLALPHLLLAIIERRVTITSELSEDQADAYVGLSVTDDYGETFQLVRLHHVALGLHPAHVWAANQLRLDEALAAMLAES
jgi:hypothetical protein